MLINLYMYTLQVDWMSEFHRRFVQAVEQLAIGKNVPSQFSCIVQAQGNLH
jgi:hypothetical protein